MAEGQLPDAGWPVVATMQQRYPVAFQRDMSCTEQEWLGWLTRAMGEVPWEQHVQAVRGSLGAGTVEIGWHPLPDLVLGLARLHRLRVWFQFKGTADEDRDRFMRRFDLYTLRGGG